MTDPEADTRPFTIWQVGDRYDWKCNICGVKDDDWEDLESAAHIAEMHIHDEHFDV